MLVKLLVSLRYFFTFNFVFWKEAWGRGDEHETKKRRKIVDMYKIMGRVGWEETKKGQLFFLFDQMRNSAF